jgi:hypothetical protein
MAVLSPLAPVVGVVQDITSPKRPIIFPQLYRLPDGRYVVSNYQGWFTDRSEMPSPGKGWAAHSAWLIDPRTSGKDAKGRIVLSENNLDRWFFRDHPPSSLERVEEQSSVKAKGDYFSFKSGAASLTLHLRTGEAFVLFLKQE